GTGDGAAAEDIACADLQLDGRHAVPGNSEPFRSILSKRTSMVLEGRFREVADRRGHRYSSRPGRPGAKRAVAHAPLSNRWRGSRNLQGGDTMGSQGRHLVDGDRGNRS